MMKSQAAPFICINQLTKYCKQLGVPINNFAKWMKPEQSSLACFSSRTEHSRTPSLRGYVLVAPMSFQRRCISGTTGCFAEQRVANKVKGSADFPSDMKEKLGIMDSADTFGTLENKRAEYVEADEKEKEEEEYVDTFNAKSRLRIKQYANIIKDYIKQKKLTDAIGILETRMLKEDRAKPDRYIFNLLIGECGRVGYTKKAFSLYNRMKERGLSMHNSTYTSLFNACANSPWPADGLTRARHLRELIKEKGIELNESNYHAMIKAFGRCGDLETAFQIMDEMQEGEQKLTDAAFNFLLQSCITDKGAGLRHALLVWRKMLKKKVKPSIYTFNLMLRCVRDCGIGEISVATDILKSITSEKRPKAILKDSSSPSPELNQTSDENCSLKDTKIAGSDMVLVTESRPATEFPERWPNLLSRNPYLGNIISLADVTAPEHRLLLVGGCSGFLNEMSRYSLKPNVKTFTQLMDCIPSTNNSEHALLAEMKKYEVQPDVDFFNMLIKKRSMRYDYEGARAVLELIQKNHLEPDLITFGVLALSCTNQTEAYELMDDMENAGFRPNAEILGAMVWQACSRHDIFYVMDLLEIVKEQQVQPNAQFLKHLENFWRQMWRLIKNKDRGLEVPEFVLEPNFRRHFRKFCMRYKSWLQEVEPEEEKHPWAQFQKKEDLGATKKQSSKQ